MSRGLVDDDDFLVQALVNQVRAQDYRRWAVLLQASCEVLWAASRITRQNARAQRLRGQSRRLRDGDPVGARR